MKRIKANIIFTEPCLGSSDDVWRSTGMQYWPDYVDWQK